MDIAYVLESAREEKPELVEKIAQVMTLTERLDPMSLADTIDEMQTIVSYASEKVAAASDVVKEFGKDVGRAFAGSAATALLASLSTDLYDAARRGLTKGRNFSRVMAANPDLKEFPDQAKLRANFSALHRYLPEFTADPLVGGAMLKNLVESDQQAAPRIIQDMLSGKKSLLESRKTQFQPTAFKTDNKDQDKALNNAMKLEKFKHDLKESEERGKDLRGRTPAKE